MSRAGGTAAALGALAALALGCDRVPSTAVTSCSQAQVLPGAVKTDVLFVIDDSGSMAEEQAAVAANLDAFVAALAASPVVNDYQIGVTNTSYTDFAGGTVYTYGPNTTAPQVPYPQGALVAIDPAVPGRILWDGTAYGGSRILTASAMTPAALVAAFQANVHVGTGGSGKEQPFRVVRAALEKAGPGGVNAGFVRPGSRLAVVILSDEDDCSDTAGVISTNGGIGNNQCHDPAVKPTLDPPQALVDFLRGPIAGEVHDVVAAVVVGLGTASLAPDCGDTSNPWCCWVGNTNAGGCDRPSECATAYDKGDRFVQLVSALGSGVTREASICGDFAATLQSIAGLLVPSTVPLDGAPADWRLLAVGVERADGTSVACPVAPFDAPNASDPSIGAVYAPPRPGLPATLTFQNACTLRQGDRIDVRIVCAG